MHGSVVIALGGAQALLRREDARADTKARTALAERSARRAPPSAARAPALYDDAPRTLRRSWYSGRGALRALDGNLLALHFKYLDFASSNIPSSFFMWWGPAWQDDERFVVSLLAVAGARMGWSAARVRAVADAAAADIAAGGDAPADDTVRWAVLVAEALATAPTALPYLTDTNDRNTRGARGYSKSRRRTVERFSAAARVTRSGDCEDLAREMVNVTSAILCRSTGWSSPVAAAAHALLRCYVASLQLGCMRAAEREPGEADPYSTGGGCDAHAWAQLTPVSTVRLLLAQAPPARGRLELARYALSPWTRGCLPVLTMDGTALKEAYPTTSGGGGGGRAARELGTSGRARLGGGDAQAALRSLLSLPELTTVKARARDDDGTYVFLLQMLVADGVVHAAGDDRTPVRELYYAQGDAYGARYADVFKVAPHSGYSYARDSVFAVDAAAAKAPLWLAATAVYSPEEADLARRTMGRFVPVPPVRAPVAWWSAEEAAALGVPAPTAEEAAAAEAALRPLLDALRYEHVSVLDWDDLGAGADARGAERPKVARFILCASDVARPEVLQPLASALAERGARVAVRAEYVLCGFEAHVALAL